jgi:hypothetical protein
LDSDRRAVRQLNNSQIVAGIFLDLQKAFDSIKHGILLAELDLIGFRGLTLSLFNSYLSGRFQFVEIERNRRKLHPISSRVPQGSVLGQLLYFIYINDIVNLKLAGNIYLFADDTAYFLHGKDFQTLKQNLITDTETIMDYLSVNKLKLNVSKSKIMFFSSSNKNVEASTNINIKNQSIDIVSQVRYLGVILDNKLNWSPHISETCSKVAKISGVLRKLSSTLPISILKILYYVFDVS